MVPLMVQTRLKELKDSPSNSIWFKDHLKVFSNQKQLGQVRVHWIETLSFREYIILIFKVLNIYNRMIWCSFFFSIFDPLQLPNEEKDSCMYGSQELSALTGLYAIPPQLALLHQMLFLSKHRLNGNWTDVQQVAIRAAQLKM